MAAALPKRSAGFMAMAFQSIDSRTAGMPWRSVDGAGGGPDRRASAIAAAVSPSHGRRPVSIS